jgi:hypothetical protein
MRKIRKLALINCIAVFIVFSVASCSDSNTASQNNKVTNSEGLASQAQKVTKEDNQWEYLVVSFGTTRFSSIEESIKNGSSKLVAFQEFANLLSGHEGIDVQMKLDLLGRFGWELVDTIGAIGGDQQLLLKRCRIEDRMKVEQEAIAKLAVILREESEKKEENLKKFLAELEGIRSKQSTLQEEGLVELDAKEKRDRVLAAQIEAEINVKKMFPEPPSSIIEKTKITSVDVDITANEEENGNMLYKGEITIVVDASDALLFDKNHYRASFAKKIKDDFSRALLRALQIGPISKASELSDFEFKTEIQIVFAGSTHTVAHGYEQINIKGYKGYWSSR